jgi:phosphatidylserine/phosphatidylglycerophosphate/cardiolipin synthase-like enzyme
MSYTADFRDIQREFSSAPTIVTRTLAETLAAADEPIYVFDGFEPLYVEEGNPEIYGRRYGEVLDEAVAQGLARRVVYDPALANDTRLDFYLRITQGPAERFGGYLRSISYTPWAVSEPITLRIGGREVEAWLGQGQQAYLMFELDGTLLVVEGPREWFTSDQATLLDSLVVAPQP